MTIINDVDMPNFTHKEIPPYKAMYMDRRILSRTQAYRDILGCPFSISLNDGALIRFLDGRKTSEHHVIINPQSLRPEKLSRAIDGFPDCNIFKAWTLALGLFTGVGVYFDTKNNHRIPQPMLHLDLRSQPLIWYREDGEYFYPHKDEDFFIRLNILLSTSKV